MRKVTRLAQGGVIVLALILIVCMLTQACTWLEEVWEEVHEEPPEFQRTDTDGYFHVRYEWNYKGSRWYYDTQIPKANYDYFSSKVRTGSYEEYVLNPHDDESMADIADLFSSEAEEEGWQEWETISFVLSFVQSMPYTSDEVATGYDEYPRYPVETLVDGRGDCEDTAILFVSIVREMGYGVALLDLKEDKHMAAGVLISRDLVDNWQGHYPLTYYTAQDDKIYAYCETTGHGWELGHKPDDLKSETARIIDVF